MKSLGLSAFLIIGLSNLIYCSWCIWVCHLFPDSFISCQRTIQLSSGFKFVVIDFIIFKISLVFVFISPQKIPNLVKFYSLLIFLWASLTAQLVKNPPAMQETPVRFPDLEDLLEKGQAMHSSILGLPLWLSWQSLPAVWETQVRSLGWEDPLEKGKAIYSSILLY